MNYYEHHIGDYDKNTSHLTACEDGIYSRMIRRYYDKEAPLPADMEQLCRLVRARSREEKKAVAAVATEFFFQVGDELHHTKCDEVLEEYLAGEPEREAKKKNEDTRLAKHRAERALLFTIINGAGLHLAWNTPMADLRAAAAQVQAQQWQGAATPPAMETATLPATAPATPATATQSPIPNHQSPVVNIQPESSPLASTVGAAEENPEAEKILARNVQIAILLRALGIKPMTSMHPEAIAWAGNPAVTDPILTAAVESARQYKGDGPISPNYLKPIVEQMLTGPPEGKANGQQQDDWFRSNSGIERKGRELGMFARGTESHNDFKDRIFVEIRKRGGKAA